MSIEISAESVSLYQNFLRKFRSPKIDDQAHFKEWQSKYPDYSLEQYIRSSFLQAHLFIAKEADTEMEFANWHLELLTERLSFEVFCRSNEVNEVLRQLHLAKLHLLKITLRYSFKLRIHSKDCCSYCAKFHGRDVQLDNIYKKHLPYKACKRTDYCQCKYETVPLLWIVS